MTPAVMQAPHLALFLLLAAVAHCSATSTETVFYVSPLGNDGNAGTQAAPFRTLTHCLARAASVTATGSDAACAALGGTYAEMVPVPANGPQNGRLALRAASAADAVTLSGVDTLPNATVWTRWTPPALVKRSGTLAAPSCAWQTTLPAGVVDPNAARQLFFNGMAMVGARWPNLNVNNAPAEALNRSRGWQPTAAGSTYGRVTDPALAGFDFSWNGALATLNVAHQFYTWTRTVANHTAGESSFNYPRNLPGLSYWANQTKGWDQNQYFLSGILGALDAPGEWFLDSPQGAAGATTLYFWPPPTEEGDSTTKTTDPGRGCQPPAPGSVALKARDYALHQGAPAAVPVCNLTVAALRFVGATFTLPWCDGCALANLDLRYPTYDPTIPEMDASAAVEGSAEGARHTIDTLGQSPSVASTHINGTATTVVNLTLAYSNNNGLSFGGLDSTMDNCLVLSTDWLGTLTYAPLRIAGNRLNVTRCTVRAFGNAGVITTLPNTRPAGQGQPQPPPQPMAGRWLEVAYSHISGGGLVGKDTALLYTGGWGAAGTHWHHNWAHNASEKCLRGDDQSRNMTVHHNVLYSCGLGPNSDSQSNIAGVGLLIKGTGHIIYANTIFDTKYAELCLPACNEPLKPYARQYPLAPVQNVGTSIFNTAAHSDFGFPCSCHNTTDKNHPGGNQSAIYNGTSDSLKLASVAGLDFRPAAGSPLIDAGVVWAPYTDGYLGAAPDIGAYEYGAPRWVAGCVGLPGCDAADERVETWWP